MTGGVSSPWDSGDDHAMLRAGDTGNLSDDLDLGAAEIQRSPPTFRRPVIARASLLASGATPAVRDPRPQPDLERRVDQVNTIHPDAASVDAQRPGQYLSRQHAVSSSVLRLQHPRT